MAIPTVFAPIKSGDFTLTPITVHKQFVISGSVFNSTSSGYMHLGAIYKKTPTPIGASQANNDPTNSINGSYKHVVWKSIDHLYYRDGYNSYSTFEHANRRYTYKFLNYSASVFSIPYMDFGESIKPGSFQLSSSATTEVRWADDGNGNIYDATLLDDQVNFPPTHNLIAKWGFNDMFRYFENITGTIDHGKYKYESYIFEPNEHSILRNIFFDDVTYTSVSSHGLSANFSGQSYILTHDRPEFNPAPNEQLTISLKVKIPASQSNQSSIYNTIISKRGVIRRNVYGAHNFDGSNGISYITNTVSSSIEDVYIDRYPYDIEFINSSGGTNAKKIRVRRSDGIRVIEVTSSAASFSGVQNHLTVVLDTGSTSIYVNNTLTRKTHSLIGQTNNDHCILFGAANRQYDQGLSGSLDEIRFYNKAVSTAENDELRTDLTLHQTAIIGNIFYRQGIIVISPHSLYILHLLAEPAYGIVNNFVMKYRGTHTIYQYEALCRVKKGAFNMTYNPTARQSFKSDLLINDMTGSVLMPYATTIGMYNEHGELMAVGKLGQAVQMRDDVDLNFLVRWDV